MDGGGSELVDSVIEMGVASTIAWTVWGGFTDVRNILHRDGQAVLLYGSRSCVMSP